jgi:hypothetical protein
MACSSYVPGSFRFFLEILMLACGYALSIARILSGMFVACTQS